MNIQVKQHLNLAPDCSEQEYLDAVRVRVAEMDGWTSLRFYTNPDQLKRGRYGLYGQHLKPGVDYENYWQTCQVPNYPQDLNTVARVEGETICDDDAAEKYELRLTRIMSDEGRSIRGIDYRTYRATALQRCEAIILTMGGKS